jgi:hypothetical protein
MLPVHSMALFWDTRWLCYLSTEQLASVGDDYMALFWDTRWLCYLSTENLIEQNDHTVPSLQTFDHLELDSMFVLCIRSIALHVLCIHTYSSYFAPNSIIRSGAAPCGRIPEAHGKGQDVQCVDWDVQVWRQGVQCVHWDA